MRIWLDPNKLAARGLTPLDVTNALPRRTSRCRRDSLGIPPSDPKQAYQMAVRVVGRLSDPRQFENIILKSNAASAPVGSVAGPASTAGSGIVLLKDVGRAELGAESYNTSLKFGDRDFSAGRRHRPWRAAAFECQCAGCGQALPSSAGGA